MDHYVRTINSIVLRLVYWILPTWYTSEKKHTSRNGNESGLAKSEPEPEPEPNSLINIIYICKKNRNMRLYNYKIRFNKVRLSLRIVLMIKCMFVGDSLWVIPWDTIYELYSYVYIKFSVTGFFHRFRLHAFLVLISLVRWVIF